MKSAQGCARQRPKLAWSLLEKDFINYCNKMLPVNNQITKIDDLFDIVNLDMRVKIVEDITKDSALKCGIQDIVSGLTMNGFELDYFHSNSFWYRHELCQEAIAHFFEAMGTGSSIEKYMRDVFPSAYDYFDNYIRGLL